VRQLLAAPARAMASTLALRDEQERRWAS